MKLIKKYFAPKEIKAILGILDEASYKFDCPAFERIRGEIEHVLFGDYRPVVNQIREGTSPRRWVYSKVANLARFHVASGNHHQWMGILDPTGEDFLRIFNEAADEMVRMGALDNSYVEELKTELQETIEIMG